MEVSKRSGGREMEGAEGQNSGLGTSKECDSWDG